MTERFVVGPWPVALLSALLIGCGQNYSDKPAAEALAERNLTPVGGQPHSPAAAPGIAAAAAAVAVAAVGMQRIGDVQVAAPEGWEQVAPSSSMRVAEYALPVAGGEPLRLAVFADIGGGVEANVERWYGQFRQPDGSSTAARALRTQVQTDGGLQATLVDVSGTFSSGMGMGGGGTSEGYRMLAAIVTSGTHVYYFKLVGPAAALATHEAGFEAMIQSLRN